MLYANFLFSIALLFLPVAKTEGTSGEMAASSSHQECTDPLLPETLSSMTPGEVNTLRRTTGLANPVCYTKYLPLFAEYTMKRIDQYKESFSIAYTQGWWHVIVSSC